MFSKLIKAISILATALSLNCNATNVDIGEITTLAKPQNLFQSNNQPIAAIQSPALIKDNGLKARGPQTIIVTLSASAEMPIVVQDKTISPGEEVQLVASVDDNGVLFLPVYPGNNVVGSAPFSVEIPNITGAWCESDYTETPVHCEKLHIAPISLQCEPSWLLDNTQRTCTLITNADKLPVCPSGWTFNASNNTCNYSQTTSSIATCPSGYEYKYGSCLRFQGEVSAYTYCQGNNYFYSRSSDTCYKMHWVNSYCPDGYQDIDSCVLTNWSSYIIKTLSSSSENCPPGTADKKRLSGSWRCLSKSYSANYIAESCPSGFSPSQPNSTLCLNYSDTSAKYYRCPRADRYTDYANSDTEGMCEEYSKRDVIYYCLEGALSGSNCIIARQQQAGTGECPADFNEIPNNTGTGDSDTICQKIDIQPAQIICEFNKVYNAENDRCEFLEIKQHITL
ncbi:hypothetical protein [Pseudoalteromonas spongiae]|uniref:hypothetical protein n=1 Tax=Pseudoalteromonas spongiae TaxID=298657 RepID=UPI000C2D1267|nr:hypothetical protein [Pseudoalteromonas spongiae]